MKRCIALASLLSLLVLGACSEQTQNSAEPAVVEAAAAPPPLIPRADVFGNPSRIQGRISPDGKHLSWLAPVDGVLNVHVAPAVDPSAARVVTQERARGVPVHFWSPDSLYVMYLQDKGGNENHHIYAANIATGEVRDLTPVADTVKATLQGVSQRRPDTVLVGLNDRDAQLFDLYEITISTGERTLVAENPGFVGFFVDNELMETVAGISGRAFHRKT